MNNNYLINNHDNNILQNVSILQFRPHNSTNIINIISVIEQDGIVIIAQTYKVLYLWFL